MPVPEKYSVDGLTPSAVQTPGSVEELSQVLARADGERLAVIPRSGGTRLHVGNLPARYDIALDLTAMPREIEHEPGDLTAIVDAAVTVADLQSQVAQAGQRLPFEAPRAAEATIGGSVASNAAGHMRTSFGGIRDWVIGMQVLMADGTVTKSGGRVVKNVQGYDLYRLHTGAFGTLGVITQVAFKLAPVAAATRTVAVWFDTLDGAAELAMRLFNSPSVPEAVSVFTGAPATAALGHLSDRPSRDEASFLLLARVSGVEPAVARQVDEITGAAGTVDATGYEAAEGADAEALWNAVGSYQDTLTLAARSSFKPRDAFKYLSALTDGAADRADEDGAPLAAEVHAGYGTVIAGYRDVPSDGAKKLAGKFFHEAARNNGTAIIEWCPVEIKKSIDVFGDAGSALATMRSVKLRFDPNNTLSPGRFIGRI